MRGPDFQLETVDDVRAHAFFHDFVRHRRGVGQLGLDLRYLVIGGILARVNRSDGEERFSRTLVSCTITLCSLSGAGTPAASRPPAGTDPGRS